MFLSPLTGSDNVTLLETIQADQLIQEWKDSLQIDITNELHGYKFIQLYQCNQTKLNFFVPFDIAGSEMIYRSLQNFDWYYMPDKWEYQVALKDFSDCKDILEVGCGFGDFIKSGIEAGLNIRGIELNQLAVIAAQKSNLPVERLNLKEAANLYNESLDGVCSFQVLEHVPNPKDFIQWSIQMIKPGGKLIYCVPNSESFLKSQYNLLDMPPHHMLQWSEVSFRALETIFSIKLEKVIFEPLAQYHVSAYLAAYAKRFRVALLGKVFFNHYTLPLYGKCLSLGFRKLLKGQSLYVQFRKL